jgi:hypothetical protein
MKYTQIKINIKPQNCQRLAESARRSRWKATWSAAGDGHLCGAAAAGDGTFQPADAFQLVQCGCQAVGVTAHLVLIEPGPELINILETITTRFDSGANRCCRRICRVFGVVTAEHDVLGDVPTSFQVGP